MNQISRLTALLLALMMLLSSVSLAEGGLPIGGASGLTSDDWASLVDQAEEELFFIDEGATGQEVIPESPEQPEKPDYFPYTDIDELTLVQSDASAEAAITASGAAILTCAEAGQWQISVDGVWANLSGETGTTLTINSAMMNGQSAAEIRKALGEKNAETGEYAAYTQTAVINIVDNPPAMFSVSRDAEGTGDASDANDGIMTLEVANQDNMVVVQVIYCIKDSKLPVADPYIGQIAKGSTLNTMLTLPRVVGYLADSCTVEPLALADVAAFTEQTATNAGSLTIDVTEEQSVEDITIYVEYVPTEVSFVVKHFQQNVDNDGYSEVATETKTGLTGDPVGDGLAKTYEGLSAIWYDPTTAIAADGSTVVEIYYNREYYLMTFDLGGGYGVEPIFARFGAEIEVSAPQRAGYTFGGWVDKTGATAKVPATMPVGGAAFVATWMPATTTFIVAYWLENPNDDGYSYWGSYQLNGTTGTTVQGETYKVYPTEVANKLDENEKRYSQFSRADENVIISGDGSAVVNVYYDRNEYTLKFYYALEKKETTDTGEAKSKYYVVGGSTYYFGQDGDDVSAIIALDNKYADSDRTGEVTGKPTLNAEGLRRNYVLDSEPSQTKDYLYHYISFTAKYGADISEKWPCDVFNSVTRQNRKLEDDGSYKNGWDGVEAHVSAWNGEHRVYYSQHASGGNETIKGNYNQLDYKLLYCIGENGCNWWSHVYHEDSATVSYLCFWENGSDDVDWNVPKLFRYNIWVPVLDGQDISMLPDEDKTERDGVWYYRRNVYDTCDNSTAGEQTAPAITGYEYTGVYTEKALTDFDSSVYQSATVVNFYYSRNTYDLVFESYTDSHEILSIPFGSDISGYEWLPSDDSADTDALPYPDVLEEGAREFVGWYTTPTFIEGTEFDFNATMPANDIALYAKWELVTHDVHFWLDKEAAEAEDNAKLVKGYPDITHGMTVGDAYSSEDDYIDPEEFLEKHQEYKDYTFDGWYFIDEDGAEMRFDIDTMPIKRDLDIYAKWTSNEPVEFVFHYTHNSEDGEKVADSYTGKALPGTLVTMSAKIGDDLKLVPAGQDPLSYIPLVNSHSLTLNVDASQNVFTFVYKQPAKVKYTVQYLAAKYEEIDGKQVLVPIVDDKGEYIHKAAEKTGETTNAIVTENYVPVLGYMPQATQLRLIVSMDESLNVLQFLYVENTTNELYDATHIVIDHNNQEKEYFSEKGKQGTIGSLVAVTKQNITGYTFSKAEVVQTWYNKETEQWVTETVGVAEKNITDTAVKHTLTDGGMHVKLYYTPVECPVTVKHLKVGTTDLLLFDERIMAAYGSTLNAEEYAKVAAVNSATGAVYRVSSYDPLTITVKVDDGIEPAENVIIIYYEPDVADIKISKQITESMEENAPDLPEDEWDELFTFTVTLRDADDQALKTVSVSFDGGEVKTETLVDGELTFPLQHNHTMTIHDLPVGTKYVIQETETNKFKTNYSTQTTGTLTMLDVDMIVTNMYPKYAGELTIKKDGLRDDKESAIVHATVGGVSYYLVLNASNNYTATISGLKPGTTYTVSEVNDWTWQYASNVSAVSGTLTETKPTATVTIKNTKESDKWLHDESHVENNFGTGESTGVNQ